MTWLNGASDRFTSQDSPSGVSRIGGQAGTHACDAGIDFGDDMVLAEVVSGTVKMPTRQDGDVAPFRADAERLVVGKLGQLYDVARSAQ